VSPFEGEEVEEVFGLEVHYNIIIDLSLKLEKGEKYQVQSK